jgi:hypothetical protein
MLRTFSKMIKLWFNCLIIIVLSGLLCSSGSVWGQSFDKEKDTKGQPTEKDRQKYSSAQPQENIERPFQELKEPSFIRKRPLQELKEPSSIPTDESKDEPTTQKGTKRIIKKTKITTRLKPSSKSKKDLFGIKETVEERSQNNFLGREDNSYSELQITIDNLFEDALSQEIAQFYEDDDGFLPQGPENKEILLRSKHSRQLSIETLEAEEQETEEVKKPRRGLPELKPGE